MTDSMLEQCEIEQGAPGARWLFVVTGGSWLLIALLVLQAV
jgi:hypothetical protein